MTISAPSAGDALRPRRVLVLQPWGMGDLVMTLPLLEAIRVAWPDAHLCLGVSTTQAARLVEGRGLCDEIQVAPPGTGSALRHLWRFRHGRFEVAIMATRCMGRFGVPGVFARYVARIPVNVADGPGYRPPGFSHWRRTVRGEHQVLSNLALGALLGVTGVPVFHWSVDPGVDRAAQALLDRWQCTGRQLVALHPGGGSGKEQKRLPLPLCLEFLRLLERHAPEARVLVFIGPDETALAVKFQGLSRVVLVEGRDLALHQALLARCRVLVAGDTGLGHLAALVGVPVVTAAGPTPVRECGPWGDRHTVVESRHAMSCRPCFGTVLWGHCPFGRRCMTTIAAADVLEPVLARLERPSLPGPKAI